MVNTANLMKGVQSYTHENVATWVRELTDNVLLVGIDKHGYRAAENLEEYLKQVGVDVDTIVIKASDKYSGGTNNKTGYREISGVLTNPDSDESPVEPVDRLDVDRSLTLVVDDVCYTDRTLAGGNVFVAERFNFPRYGRMASYVEHDVNPDRENYFPTFSHNRGIGRAEHTMERMKNLAAGNAETLEKLHNTLVSDGELRRIKFKKQAFLYYLYNGGLL